VRLISVDCETTGLDPLRHEVWEIALVPVCRYPDDPDEVADTGPERLYQLPVNLNAAEPDALKIGGYNDRAMGVQPGRAYRWKPESGTTYEDIPILGAALEIQQALDGATLLGMSVHFDAGFIHEFLRKVLGRSTSPPWHHRFLDLGSYAGGAERAGRSFASLTLADRIPNLNAHSALDDARWNTEVYHAINDGRF
jgi:DNA polymerase III epsilon subunit-like protein